MDEVLGDVDRALHGSPAEVRAFLRDMLDGGRLDVVRRSDGLFEARGGLLPPVGLGAVTGVDCGGRKVTRVSAWSLAIPLAA